MSSFEILRKSIKLFKQEDLGIESFSEAVDEFSSDPNECYKLVIGLRKYTHNIEFYNFQDLKLLDEDQRYVLAVTIQNLSEEYLSENGISSDWNESDDY